MPLPIVGRLSRGVAGGVGLAQEAYYHNKDKKETSRSPSPQPPPFYNGGEQDNDGRYLADAPPSYDEIDIDEDDWIADEAQENLLHSDNIKGPDQQQLPLLSPTPSNQIAEESTDKIVSAFLARHPAPSNLAPTPNLPAPVVVPQRRPATRTRGFVRAYAPALESCNVSEAAFLDFLKGFDQEISKQNAFNAANLALALSIITYFAAAASPEIALKFAATAVHISIEAGRRLYISKKENSYMDEMNEKFFRPRGLYAMVMCYKPNTKDIVASQDFTTASTSAINNRVDTDNKSKMADYRAASGKTRDNQLPAVCPLVYPGLDNTTPGLDPSQRSEAAQQEKNDNAFRRAIAFSRDYYDRRGQASYASAHPDSGMPGLSEQTFKGSYGDPRNFQQSGLLGVLSNNKVDPRGRRIQRRNQARIAQGRKPRGQGNGGGGSGGLVGRVFGDGALYVLVVNMPSDAELEEARELVETLKKSKKEEGKSWWQF